MIALALSARPTRAPFAAPAPYCISQRYLGLAGVRLGMPEDSVRRILGSPHREARSEAAAEGGLHERVILHFHHVEVELSRGRSVTRLIATGPRAMMPGGVRPGQTVEEVVGRLSAPEELEELDEVTWSPAVCQSGPMDSLAGSVTVSFTWVTGPGSFDVHRSRNQSRVLSRIELSHLGPADHR
jgi:hypothetical protein